MHNLRTVVRLVTVSCVVWMACAALPAHAIVSDAGNHVSVRLLAQQSAADQSRVRVAVVLSPEPGWHTYWLNPGDSGLATRVQWTLPTAWVAEGPLWPAPEATVFEGMTNYGYADPHALIFTFSSSGSGIEPDAVVIADVQWLACSDICIPESTLLEAPLGQIINESPPVQMDGALAALPQALSGFGSAASMAQGIAVSMPDGFSLPSDFVPVRLFAEQAGIVEHGSDQRFDVLAGRTTVVVAGDADAAKLPDESAWVLVGRTANGQSRAYRFVAQSIAQAAPTDAQAARTFVVPAVADVTGRTRELLTTDAQLSEGAEGADVNGWSISGLVLAMLAAAAGGLLLNLMPCVLPVLSMKILSIAQSHAGGPGSPPAEQRVLRRRQRQHALSYTLGVVLSFVALAVALVGLRSVGQQIGWGFQLQSPVFVATLVYVVFVMGLSLSGVVSFGGSLMGVGQGLTTTPSLQGSFFTGAFAVLVASPCSAPFMAPAMGWALMQPPALSIPVFVCLGLGMALPMAVISMLPGLSRWLPKPGNWMVRFKQVMAFPMYATAVWLLWVLSHQVSVDHIALVLAGATVIALGCWMRGIQQSDNTRAANPIWAIAPIIVASFGLIPLTLLTASEPASTELPAARVVWSESALEERLAQGHPVFVDMTAAWCVTCKANEINVLNRDTVQAAFRQAGVVQMVGDWTTRDPAITQYLAQFGRSGVPLYVLYDADGRSEVLPQLLNTQNMLQKLDGLGA